MKILGEKLGAEQKIWRYMKLNRFLEMLETKSIHFASADQFKDPFEGAVAVQSFEFPIDPRYAEFDAAEKAFAELKKLTKINCWHIENYESDAMWKLYSDLGKGVAIATTLEKLDVSLEPYRIKPEYGIEDIWAGNVTYVDLLKERLKVSMLERYFYKHKAFSWEKEFRLAISVRIAHEFGVDTPKEGVFVNADIVSLIDEIHLGPSLSEKERNSVVEACELYEFRDRIKISSLLGRPRYI